MTQGTPEYKHILTRWAALTRLNDEHGLTHAEGAELVRLGRELDAAERSIAGLMDDYAEALRNANHLGTVEL